MSVSSTPHSPDPPTTTLLAVGDIMLSRNVGTKIEQSSDPNLPFEKLIPILQSADITFGNLECPLSDSTVPVREGLVFRCLIKHFSGVVNAGFDALSTANNHSFDQGPDNIDFTIDYLHSQNILSVGTNSRHCEERSDEAILPSNQKDCFPLDSARRRNDNIVERNGIKFGFLAYSYSAFNDGKNTTHPQIATMDIDQLKTDVANLRSEADIIIISMHAGTEYTRHPNQAQVDFAHAAINAGADLILGHHPHWIQTIEIYNNKPIFYSLGNFVFDQMWSQETREGLMVKFEFQGRELKSYELLPVVIDNFCCPRLANEAEKQKILEKIEVAKFSKP